MNHRQYTALTSTRQTLTNAFRASRLVSVTSLLGFVSVLSLAASQAAAQGVQQTKGHG